MPVRHKRSSRRVRRRLIFPDRITIRDDGEFVLALPDIDRLHTFRQGAENVPFEFHAVRCDRECSDACLHHRILVGIVAQCDHPHVGRDIDFCP